VVCATKFCTVVPNMPGFSVGNLLLNDVCDFVPV
jgi:hypothetical protein